MKERQWLLQGLNLIHEIAIRPGEEKLSVEDLESIKTVAVEIRKFCSRKIKLRKHLATLIANGYDAFEYEDDEERR